MKKRIAWTVPFVGMIVSGAIISLFGVGYPGFCLFVMGDSGSGADLGLLWVFIAYGGNPFVCVERV